MATPAANDTTYGPYTSGEPPWEAQILGNLDAAGALGGVSPAALSAFSQYESGYEDKGAGINSEGYGGYFGLGENSVYPGQSGPIGASVLDTNSPASFTEQAEVAAAELASLIKSNNGSVYQAALEYDGGAVGEAQAVAAAQGGSLGGGSIVNATGTGGSNGQITGAGSNGSGASSANPHLAGIGGFLQDIDGLLNPSGGNFFTQLATLGTSDVKALVIMVAARSAFSLLFLGVTAVGVVVFTRGSGSSGIISTYQKQQGLNIAKGNLEIGQKKAGILSDATGAATEASEVLAA